MTFFQAPQRNVHTKTKESIMNESSFIEMQEEAEEQLGPQALFDLQKQLAKEQPKQKNATAANFFFANLGAERDIKSMRSVPIQRQNPFQHFYGDMHENPFAFMLEELDDNADSLIELLGEINRNLDREMEKLSSMIGETGPRHSTKFQDIAFQLQSKLRDKVNSTKSSRRSSIYSEMTTSINQRGASVFLAQIDASTIEQDRSIIKHQSPRFSQGSFDDSLRNDIDLLAQCDLFRQMTIETIKEEQNTVSHMSIKEKQIHTFGKLEALKIELLRLVCDLEDTVTYNPFVGANQVLARDSDGAPLYNSFIMDDQVDDALSLADSEEKKRQVVKMTKESEKKRLAELLHKIVYQLEKLRFNLEKNIYPRDLTLRLFDTKEKQEEDGASRKYSIVQLNNDRHLLLAFKLLHKLQVKINQKMQTNKHQMLIQQLQSKVQIQSKLYQSFHGFLSEHDQQDLPVELDTKKAILKARFELVKLIKNKQFNKIDLTQDLNQHLLRLVMPKHDRKKSNDVEQMLQEDIFVNFKINSMNWTSLLVNEDVQQHYEVTLQLFCGNGKQLSDKAMIPLIKDGQLKTNEPVSWTFLQIPMQAMITSDLSLCIEVYKVEYKYGDIEPMRFLGVTKSCSPIKTLQGWSTINLFATYALSNVISGQIIPFKKLRFFEVAKGSKFNKISDRYQDIMPEDIKMSVNSAILTQILCINGHFSFDSDFHKVKRQLKSEKSIHVGLHRVFERGIYTKNKDMQKRLLDTLSSSFNQIQVCLSSIRIPNPPQNSLICIEICLINDKCELLEENFRTTLTCSSDNVLSCFESETKEITSSGTIEFRDIKYLKLPSVEKVADYSRFSLLVIVKMGRSNVETDQSPFAAKVNVLDQWKADPSVFSFRPTYLSVLPLFNESDRQLLNDQKHQQKLLVFDQSQYLQMIQRAHQYGGGNLKKLQTWMFSECQNETVCLETRLISNRHSTVNVINYILSMENPQKMTMETALKMLSKLRRLVTDNPVELLIHHSQILDKIFVILSIDYDIQKYGLRNINGTLNDSNLTSQSEGRQDVAFEILLLMIDLFHEVFPEYKQLFTKYIEERFYHPKVFVALTAQLRLIEQVFKQDISDTNRFTLTQTLSYFPAIIKILRISFIQHQMKLEKLQKDHIDQQIRGKPKINVKNVTTIQENSRDGDESHDRNSASFFQPNQQQLLSSAPFFGTPNQSLPKQTIVTESNMIDNFLNETNRQAKVEQNVAKQTQVADRTTFQMESFVVSTDENVLLQSSRSDISSDLMNQSTDSRQASFFLAKDSEKEKRRQVQQIASDLSKDTFQQKKKARETWRAQLQNDLEVTSNFLRNLPESGDVEEEDIQKNVAQIVIEVFQGCHQDGLKITMFLRGILLKNFHEILKEVSLICGAKTVAILMRYLYCPTSLQEQFKQTGQLDSGLANYFKEFNKDNYLDKSTKDFQNPEPEKWDDTVSSVFISQRMISIKNDKKTPVVADNENLKGSHQKIRLMESFIGGGHFPFGADIDSSITELYLNQLRVLSMGKILYERTLEKIPGNSNQVIEETVMRFCKYVDMFGNVASTENVSDDVLVLRIHVFYFLHQLFFYVIKSESVHYDADQKTQGRRQSDTDQGISLQRTVTRYIPLVQNTSNYLHSMVNIFMSSMYQLSQDLLMFKAQASRVSKLLESFPQIEERMGPFLDQSSLVLLTMISHASKRYLRINFFPNRPSILAKLLDNFNRLDEQMNFTKPFSTYVDKQRLDIMAQFNQNVSELIIDQFGRELPELYIPVVNKLLFRYLHLWLIASHAELNESKHQKKQKMQRYLTQGDGEMKFNRGRLLENSWKLVSKFKRKCLPDIIEFRSYKQEDNQAFLMQTKERDLQRRTVCWRRAEQKETLTKIFERMHTYYEVSGELQGVEVSIQLLLEAALLEYEETNQVASSSSVLFQMFTQIKYLSMGYKEVQIYISLLSKLLAKYALEQTSLRVNGEAFRTEFVKNIKLLEDTYHALYHFRQSKAKSNIFLRVLYGCRVIELLSKAKLYHEIKQFARKEYQPILEKEFEWKTEIAFLDLHCQKILQKSLDQGSIYLGNDQIRQTTLSDEISRIVDEMVACRCYAIALDLNVKVKMIYQKNYDLERIQKPLKMEGFIYDRMHKDNKQNYASYFKVEFLGNGHIQEFKDKTFILRSIANQDKLTIEDELRERFDEDINFIEETWPSEEQLRLGHSKYCHLVRVKPLTLKEVDEFDLHDMIENREIIMDDDDNHLLEKIQAMPSKLQNFYIQNNKDKFYYQESVRIPGVDAVAFDQKIQIFSVKRKFPYIIGMQQVFSRKHKLVSSVRQAIKDIKDTDNALSIIKKTVTEQAIDQENVYALETTLRKTLVTEINGGFERYLINFFSDKSLSIKDREELLLKLYVTMKDHFTNVKESIDLFSKHSTHDSATSMFYSKLSALERMLSQVEKKTQANRILEEREEKEEIGAVAEIMRYSTNVLHVNERDSLKEPSGMHFNSYLISSDLNKAQKTEAHQTLLAYTDGHSSNFPEVRARRLTQIEEQTMFEHLARSRDVLDPNKDSFVEFDQRRTQTEEFSEYF